MGRVVGILLVAVVLFMSGEHLGASRRPHTVTKVQDHYIKLPGKTIVKTQTNTVYAPMPQSCLDLNDLVAYRASEANNAADAAGAIQDILDKAGLAVWNPSEGDITKLAGQLQDLNASIGTAERHLVDTEDKATYLTAQCKKETH